MKKIDNMTYDELEKQMVSIGEPKFRAKQVFDWIHNKTVDNFDDLTNVSKKTREILMKNYEFTQGQIEVKLESEFDQTKKYIIKLEDENIVESVYLKYKYGNTACISSQVGCKMGCTFCASTKNGFIRNLTASEMLKQVYLMQQDIEDKINNIVIMGSGEPLDNYDNIIDFLNIINDERGQNVSLRKITLSTCGIVPNIYKLADENLPITLAISLHAPTQEKREKLMPTAKRYNLKELIESCEYYLSQNNRRLTFEYILIKDFNDSQEDAKNLYELLRGKLCNVNLISYNSIKESDIIASSDNNIEKFKRILCDNGINATIRRELGSDINAACGQLRNNFLNK